MHQKSTTTTTKSKSKNSIVCMYMFFISFSVAVFGYETKFVNIIRNYNCNWSLLTRSCMRCSYCTKYKCEHNNGHWSNYESLVYISIPNSLFFYRSYFFLLTLSIQNTGINVWLWCFSIGRMHTWPVGMCFEKHLLMDVCSFFDFYWLYASY